MIQLYLFIVALIITVAIVSRRLSIVKKTEKKEFRKVVAEKVDANRKEESMENKERFKDSYMKAEEDKKQDLSKFKDEMRRADLALAKGSLGEAKKYLIQAMSLSTNDVMVSLKLAKAYMDSDDLKRAETLYRKLIDEDPENPEIYENLGRILLKRKAYKEAVHAFCRAVELDDKDDQKFLALGKLYHLMMRYDVAAECFKRAAELKPREVNHLFLLADSCAADDDYENALFTYERILTIEPYNDRAKSSTHDIRLKIKEQETVFKD